MADIAGLPLSPTHRLSEWSLPLLCLCHLAHKPGGITICRNVSSSGWVVICSIQRTQSSFVMLEACHTPKLMRQQDALPHFIT